MAQWTDQELFLRARAMPIVRTHAALPDGIGWVAQMNSALLRACIAGRWEDGEARPEVLVASTVKSMHKLARGVFTSPYGKIELIVGLGTHYFYFSRFYFSFYFIFYFLYSS